jgi:1-acyl-sn-glycerol-3-phosphate acyltransferase
MRRALFVLWYMTVFILGTIPIGVVSLAMSFVNKTLARRITTRGWARVVLDPAFIRVEASGRERLPAPGSGGFILFSNHRSLLDIPIVAEATGRSISWVAKAALGRIPVFGWSINRVHLLVDRGGSAEAAKNMISEASARLAEGEIMAIFPEGTRNKTATPILPFKKGAFILAKHTGVPLVPMAIRGTGGLWPSGRLCPRPGLVKVAIGEPMSIEPGDTLNKLSLKAHRIIEELYLSLGGPDSEPDFVGDPSSAGADGAAPPDAGTDGTGPGAAGTDGAGRTPDA